MTLDDLPMSSVGKKVRIEDEKFRHEGYLVSFSAETEVITTTTALSSTPVAHYFSPTQYHLSILVGATVVDYTTSDPNIKIDLVKE